MTISSTTFIALAISIGVALIIMVTAWVWMRKRIKKIKLQYQEENLEQANKLKPRENYGKLLWELKNKSNNPLDDYQMEFILNTAWLNKYQTFTTESFTSDYEKTSLVELVNLKFNSENPDLVLLNTNPNLQKDFAKYYKLLKSKQMIIITNASKKIPIVKNFLSDLKHQKIKYEWQNYGQGIILVVK